MILLALFSLFGLVCLFSLPFAYIFMRHEHDKLIRKEQEEAELRRLELEMRREAIKRWEVETCESK